MKKLFAKKYFAVGLIAVLAIVLVGASSGVAMAQVTAGTAVAAAQAVNAANSGSAGATQAPNPYSCGLTTLGTCIPYVIFMLVSPAISLLITLGAWIIQVGLQLSANIYNSSQIQNGFGVCLSIANLGFVLAIIIIAIATILRSETYGYKKTLWRLIVMAILVNFGLVITAPIINFANGMTNYFMSAINGGQGGVQLFINNLATVNNIGAADQGPTGSGTGNNAKCTAESVNPTSVPAAQLAADCASIGPTVSSPATVFTQSLMALLFAIIFKLVIALAYFSIGALMFVRYIYLGILLILLPLAWMMWIFPKFSHEFGRWWSNFIKWAFFGPAAMFFIWLAMGINSTYLSAVANTGTNGVQAVNTPTAAIAQAVGPTVLLFLGQFMNNIIILAIMIGGLIAASSLTGKAGSFVVEQAKSVSGAVQGYVGKQTKKGARAAFQKAGGQTAAKNLRTGQFLGINKIPGFLGGGVVRRGASLAGRGISKIDTNEALVEAAKKNVPKNPEEIRENLRGSMNTEDQYAHIAKLVEAGEFRTEYKDKDGKLKDEMVNGQTMKEFMNQNLSKDSDVAQRFGQVKMGGDADKAAGGNKDVRIAEAQLKAAKEDKKELEKDGKASTEELATASKKINDAANALDSAMGEFIDKMQKGDMAKVNVNEVFQHDTELSRALLKQFALRAPQLVTGALPKMKAKNLLTLDATYRDVIKNAFADGTPAEQERLVGKDKKTGRLKSVKDPSPDSVLGRYNKAFGSNVTGFSTGGGGGSSGGGGGDGH